MLNLLISEYFLVASTPVIMNLLSLLKSNVSSKVRLKSSLYKAIISGTLMCVVSSFSNTGRFTASSNSQCQGSWYPGVAFCRDNTSLSSFLPRRFRAIRFLASARKQDAISATGRICNPQFREQRQGLLLPGFAKAHIMTISMVVFHRRCLSSDSPSRAGSSSSTFSSPSPCENDKR